MHIHISDTTYKLLDRKLYEIQERPRMALNGSMAMNTYFVLNKKDRSGTIQLRPFEIVLKEMRKEEIEEAKLKQRNNLKENGFDHLNSRESN